MSNGQDFTTATALEARERNELGDWVARFLASPGSDNAELGELLNEQLRWWMGPLELPIDQLNRLAGPPGSRSLRQLDDDEWRDDVPDLADRIEEDGLEPPPVVVQYRDDQLVLEDGNHRVEALRRAGIEKVWAVVGFVDEARRDQFVERFAPDQA